MMECGIRWAVEARRKGRGEEKQQEQRRREEPLEEMQVESTDEPEVTSRVAEMKTGRGSASLVQGRWTDMKSWTRPVEKEKTTEEKENTRAKEDEEAKERGRRCRVRKMRRSGP